MKTDNYDRLVCIQAKELFKLCFFYTEENLNLFSLAELSELSNMCKYIANETDKRMSEIKGNEDNKQSKCNSCRNNTDELSGECYECVKGIKDNYISELKGE